MILQLQAKVHGLGYLGVSTCTYQFSANLKQVFGSCLPSFLTIIATVVATTVAALTTTINLCKVVAIEVTTMSTKINFCIFVASKVAARSKTTKVGKSKVTANRGLG